MSEIHLFQIQGADNEVIVGKYFIPKVLKSPFPVIIAHGFKGFMDWGHFPMIGEQIADNGHIVIMFNFSHNGTSIEQPTDFCRLDLFAQNTYSKELFDLGCVLDEVQKSPLLKAQGANCEKVILIGHSRGGGISILKAAQDKRIVKLITWAATGSFGTFFASSNEFVEQWKHEGQIFTYNSRTKQQMPLNYSLYEDVLLNEEKLNIQKAAAQISIPWLIMHGADDSTVPVDIAHQFHKVNPQSELYIMDDADHNFGGKHPLSDLVNYEHLKLLLSKTVDFIE